MKKKIAKLTKKTIIRKVTLLNRIFAFKKRVAKSLLKRPIITFSVLLFMLFGFIIVGNQLRKPHIKEDTEQVLPKQVKTFHIGTAPKISVNARIEKSGVVTIVAQTSGVIRNIFCTEGETFGKGRTLVSLSTNYQGGNVLTVQRKIAQKSYDFSEQTFDLQKDIIAKQRNIAEQGHENDDELRKIVDSSIGETKDLISLSESTISMIDDNITYYEELSNPTTQTEKEIVTGLKQQKISLVNGLNAAKSGLRNSEYSTDEENPPKNLSDISKDLALKQLELQEKSLELNKDISLLQLRLAQINEGLMYPAAPFTGKIERIHVRKGQAVSPGTPIATISGDESTITAVALVSKHIAENVSQLEKSTLYAGSLPMSLMPTYVSTEPTNNQLFTVLYHIPETYNISFTEGQYIPVDIPVGYPDALSSIPFIPLDAIYQTQDQTFIFVNENDIAQSREVTLGSIFGSFVEITSGLEPDDEVVLDRSISSGEKIQAL